MGAKHRAWIPACAGMTGAGFGRLAVVVLAAWGAIWLMRLPLPVRGKAVASSLFCGFAGRLLFGLGR